MRHRWLSNKGMVTIMTILGGFNALLVAFWLVSDNPFSSREMKWSFFWTLYCFAAALFFSMRANDSGD